MIFIRKIHDPEKIKSFTISVQKEISTIGEPVLVMLVEDNADHAELVIRTLQDHRIANTIKHFSDGQSHWITCSVRGNIKTLRKARIRT